MTTACGFDCYDACKIIEHEGRFKGDKNHPAGNGALCKLVNKSIHDEPRITTPRINNQEVFLDEAMDAVYRALSEKNSLLWRGSGNMGVMQEVTNLLMEKIDGTLTHGSLCDGAGDAGIVMGRGVNKTLPLEQIEKAETVIIWGRNLTVTNAHLMPFLEGKNIVVIDPVKTAIAKKADFHLQIQPRTDYYVALMLSRFVFMEDGQNDEWLEEFAPEHEEFYDFTREHRIKPILEYCGTDLGEMGHVMEFMRDKKVVILVGTGVQKYTTGSYALHAIDSLASTLGLFGQEGCGVHYLGNSTLGFENPFEVNCKTVSKVVTPFNQFDTVLVQGGNPCESMPDSNRVNKELDEVKNLIYFGLYENETSKRASIVIPAKNFFEKNDVRLSYGHHYISKMNTLRESDIGLSEYEFNRILFEKFNFKGLKSEETYIESWLSQCKKEKDEYLSPAYESLPYKEGFGVDGEDDFEFIEEYDDDFINTKRFTKYRKMSKNKKIDQSFWLISVKTSDALNTQFKRDNSLKIHPNSGYKEGQQIKLTSSFGEIELEVKLSEDVREDCIVVGSNVIGLNKLTPSIESEEGNSACFQEVKVVLETV